MLINKDVDPTLWEPLPDVLHRTDNFRGYAMASARDTVYISGGQTDAVHNSLQSFSMTARKWTELPSMNYHRWGHRLAVIEGGRYLFAIGGWGYKSASVTSKPKKSLLKSVLRSKGDKVGAENKGSIEKLASYEVYDVTKQVWKDAGNLNEARRGFALVDDSVSGKIYVFGGVGEHGPLASVEVYNPYENIWDLLKPMPEAKSSCEPVVVGSNIYLFENGKKTLTYNTADDKWTDEIPDVSFIPKSPVNGKVCSTCFFSGGGIIIYRYPVKECDGEISDRWMIAHMAHKRTKTWTVSPPVDAISYYKMAVSDGKLVIVTRKNVLAFQIVDDMVDDASTVVSSHSSSQSGSLMSNKSRGEIEPIKDDGTWSLQPEFPSKPQDFRGYAVVSIGNLVYISGGCSGDGTIYRSFLSYNVSTKKWTKLPGMTHRRLGHKMAVSSDGGYVFVIGGGDGKTMRSMGVDIYDIIREVWMSAPSMNEYRVFFGTTVCSGKVFAFGGIGSDNGNQLKTVEVFDPMTYSWEFTASMPEARGVCNVITVGTTMFVFGTPSQKVLAFDSVSEKWLEDVTLQDSSLPSSPPGGCVCGASSYEGGEVLVVKYPLEGLQGRYRRTAYIYDSEERIWTSVHLLDEFACYSVVVAGKKCVVVTPQNQLQACTIPITSC